ncbi:MAG: alpha/beta hydrolase, partial [Actinomycetota bacterium]
RLRAGPRAVLTIAIGIVGLIVGSEAAYDTAAGQFSGDDVSGILSLLAGLVLLALGVAALWRSRRRDGSRAWRWTRRVLLGVATVLVGVVVVFPVAMAYGVTHIASSDVPAAELGAPHQDVTFTTDDGLALSGWYVPSRNGAAVIALGMSRESPREHAAMLARHGYGVLVYDQRGWGASEGDPNAYGWRGSHDVAAAVDFLSSRPEVDPGRIGGLGLSVGGEMMITAAAESQGLAAVVSEGAGERSVREFVEGASGSDWLSLPTYAGLTSALTVFSNGGPPPNLADLTGRIAPRPLMLIYGENGQALERVLNLIYAAEAGEPTTLWEVPGSGHAAGMSARPREYERRVVGFFDGALLGG